MPKMMGFLQLVTAFDRYALAAVATDQMSLASEMAHKHIWSQVLAVHYDEAARQSWADSAYNGIQDFEVNKVACRLDEDIFRLAESMFDKRHRTEDTSASGKQRRDLKSRDSKFGDRTWSEKRPYNNNYQNRDSYDYKGQGQSWGSDKGKSSWHQDADWKSNQEAKKSKH